MAELIVRRRRDTVGILRRIKIRVNGSVMAQLRPGAEVVLTLPAGTYKVTAHVDWLNSKVLNLDMLSATVLKVEVSSPWRKKLFSTEPGGVKIYLLSD